MTILPLLEWTIVALSHSVDKTSGALSIFNVLEGINVPADMPEPSGGMPIGLPYPFCIIQLWSRELSSVPEKLEARIQIVAPNGNELATVPVIVDLETSNRGRILLNVPAFLYAGAGNYRFETKLKVGDEWAPMTAAVVSVAKAGPPQVTPSE
jgi:hypothetical protein